MPKRNVVELTEEQTQALIRREDGPLTRRQRNRVQILLRSDSGETDQEIADGLGVGVGTVADVRRRFALGGLDAALDERPRPGAVPVLDGEGEALVIATACSPVPEGRATWTARMIGDRLVELRVVESVSGDTIPRVLKRATSSRGRRRRGACRRA